MKNKRFYLLGIICVAITLFNMLYFYLTPKAFEKMSNYCVADFLMSQINLYRYMICAMPSLIVGGMLILRRYSGTYIVMKFNTSKGMLKKQIKESLIWAGVISALYVGTVLIFGICVKGNNIINWWDYGSFFAIENYTVSDAPGWGVLVHVAASIFYSNIMALLVMILFWRLDRRLELGIIGIFGFCILNMKLENNYIFWIDSTAMIGQILLRGIIFAGLLLFIYILNEKKDVIA